MSILILRALILGMLGLALGGCLQSAPPEPPALWDQDCDPVGLLEPQLPLLQSLYEPAQWAQRQATRQRLHVHVPVVDLHALGRDLNPELDSVPSQLPEPLPSYAVGDLHAFRVLDADGLESWEADARLVYKSDTSYAWVEVDTGANEKYIRRLIADFDSHVYLPTRDYFGPELPAGFDRDPRIHLLFARNLGEVLGYFSSVAGISQQVHPLANEKDMLFLNLDYVGKRREDLDVLAHELEHLVHWFYAPGERSFIDEGFAELATIRWRPLRVNDSRLQDYNRYRHHPALQLNSWSVDDFQAVGRHYGSGLGFAVYLTELLGPDMIREVVAEPRRGIDGLEFLLRSRGCAFAFDDLFADFVLANLVWDPYAMGGAGRLGFETFTPWLEPVRHRQLDQTPLAAGAPVGDALPPYAVHYLSADPEVLAGDTPVVFAGDPVVPIVPDAASQGQVMWSSRHNESQAHLTRTFDLTGLEPGQSAWLETRMWWDIEENWDFGYVMASRNGRDWILLESEATVPQDRLARSLGVALTGRNAPTDQAWSVVQWDLSPYAGDKVWLRFAYVTDGAVTGTGWVIDEVVLDAIGYRETFDGALADWEVEGWIQTPNAIPVDWLVQAVVLTEKRRGVQTLDRWLADASGRVEFAVPGLTGDERLYLLVSPLAPLVTGSAAYTLQLGDDTASAAWKALLTNRVAH